MNMNNEQILSALLINIASVTSVVLLNTLRVGFEPVFLAWEMGLCYSSIHITY